MLGRLIAERVRLADQSPIHIRNTLLSNGRSLLLRQRARQTRPRNHVGKRSNNNYSTVHTAYLYPQGFEELLSSTNGLNRKLEEVLEMTREYETIASLWHSFYELMRSQETPDDQPAEDLPPGGGLPGTGGHVVPTMALGPKT
jgi:DASH complex subunit DAD1